MSELKDKLTKEVAEIEKTISNPDEKVKVLGTIQEMIGEFTKHIITLTERQNEMDEKLEEMYDVLSDIEEELVTGLGEMFEAECPYCGETIPLDFSDSENSDFECPKCHNIIEMEMMFDGHQCDCEDCSDCDDDCDDDFEGCDGNCGHCGGHHEDDEEDK